MLSNILVSFICFFIILVPIVLIILIIRFGIKAAMESKISLQMVENGNKTNFYDIDLKEGNLFFKKMFSKDIIYSKEIKYIRLSLQQEYIPEETETTEKEKSVIGRAVVGGILLGPVGAIVGGMSGIGTKKQIKVTQKEETKYYLLLKDIKENKDYLFYIPSINLTSVKFFIDRYKREGGY